MLSLEQIRILNAKVQKALEVISQLRTENKTLRSRLGDYEKRMGELETLVSSFNTDQNEIENGILGILSQLDRLEEEITSQPSGSGPAPVPAAEAPSAPVPKAEPAAAATEPAPEKPLQETLREESKPAAVQSAAPSPSEPEEEGYRSEVEAELDIF